MKFRFTTRTLGVVVLFVALLVGLWVSTIGRQRSAVAEIDRLGGHVLNVFPGQALFQGPIYPSWLPESLQRFYPMDVNYVCLTGDQIEDKHLEPILALTNLYGLDLNGSRITDKSLKELYRLSGLRELVVLDVDTITDSSIAEIQRRLPDCYVIR